MKPYPTLDVELSYQNFGSAWLGVLRGKAEDIQQAFNGLFNLRATNGESEKQDHLGMVVTFWTSKRAMRRFFFNQFFLSRCSGWRGQGRLIRNAMRYAWQKLATLRESVNSESFRSMDGGKYVPTHYHRLGTVSAERPDSDFRDAVLAHAFAAPESKKD